MKKIILGTMMLFIGHVAMAQEALPTIDKKTEINIEPLGIEVDNNLKVYYPSVTVLKSNCGDVGNYLYQEKTSPINATFISKSYEKKQDLRGETYNQEYYIANISDSCSRQVAIDKVDVEVLMDEQIHNNNSVQSIEKNMTSF